MTRNLRAFPHIVKQINLLWGHPELELYIRKLQLPDRNRPEGFPPVVFKELMKIQEVHRLLLGAPEQVAFDHPTL